MFSTLRSSVVDPKLFFSDPDPIFRRVLDPDSDPSWLVKSFGSSFGSRVSISLFFVSRNTKQCETKKLFREISLVSRNKKIAKFRFVSFRQR
jgi:hypothetical protein